MTSLPVSTLPIHHPTCHPHPPTGTSPQTVGVSSLDGLGIDKFLAAVAAARTEYERDYLPQMTRMRREKEEEAAAQRDEQLERLRKDRAEGELVDIGLPSATLKQGRDEEEGREGEKE